MNLVCFQKWSRSFSVSPWSLTRKIVLWKSGLKFLVFSRGGSRKFRKRGPSPPASLPPPHPRPQRENFTFQDMQYTAFEGVFVMQSKVTLTFRKTELKSILSNDFQSKIIMLVEEKRVGRGPLGPSPKSAYVQCHAISKWKSKLFDGLSPESGKRWRR